jgi:hypothetical protein
MISFLASLFVLALREGEKLLEYGSSHLFGLPKIFNYLLAYTYVKVRTIYPVYSFFALDTFWIGAAWMKSQKERIEEQVAKDCGIFA